MRRKLYRRRKRFRRFIFGVFAVVIVYAIAIGVNLFLHPQPHEVITLSASGLPFYFHVGDPAYTNKCYRQLEQERNDPYPVPNGAKIEDVDVGRSLVKVNSEWMFSGWFIETPGECW